MIQLCKTHHHTTCTDIQTFTSPPLVESQKNPLCYSFHKELPSRPSRPSHQRFENAQRNRSTEMILTSHANSLGACCQILRHCLRGMQPLRSDSSSEYKTLAIVKVCDRMKHSVQLDGHHCKITYEASLGQSAYW